MILLFTFMIISYMTAIMTVRVAPLILLFCFFSCLSANFRLTPQCTFNAQLCINISLMLSFQQVNLYKGQHS